MSHKYPMLTKYLIVLGLAVLAVLIPVAVLKIILGLAAIIVFSLTLKKFSALLITLAILFVVLPAIAMVAIQWAMPSIQQWLNIPNLWQFNRFWEEPFAGWDSRYRSATPQPSSEWRDHATGYQYLQELGLFLFVPDAEVRFVENVVIEGRNLEVSFDPEIEGIMYPDEMRITRRDKTITLVMPNWNDTRFRVVVGTAQPLRSMTIKGTVLRMNGVCKTDSLMLSMVTASIDGPIEAREVEFRGTTLAQSGRIDAREVRFSAVTLALKMELVNTQSVIVNGTTIGGDIKYLDRWDGTRLLRVQATTGMLNVKTDQNNQGKLDLDIHGRIGINRSNY